MTLKTKQGRFESYEVYDERGNPVGRVILPRQRRFLGNQRGTVYLERQPKLRSANSSTNSPQAA